MMGKKILQRLKPTNVNALKLITNLSPKLAQHALERELIHSRDQKSRLIFSTKTTGMNVKLLLSQLIIALSHTPIRDKKKFIYRYNVNL